MTQKKYSVSDLQLYRRLMLQARPYWPHLGLLLGIRLIRAPLALMNPIPLKIAVDSVIGTHPLPPIIDGFTPAFMQETDFRLLLWAAILQILIVLAFQLKSIADHVFTTRTGEGLKINFREALLQHVQRLSVSFHDTRGTSDSIYRIQYDAPAIQSFVIQGVLPVIVSTVTLFTLITVVLGIDWQLSLVALGISPLLILLTRSYKNHFRGRYKYLKELDSSALKVVQEVLTSLRIVKAFGREDDGQDRYVRQAKLGMKERIRLAVAEGAFGLLVNVTTAIGTSLVLFYGIVKVQREDITLGDLLIISAYLSQLYGPLKSVSNMAATIQSSLASAHRAFDLLDQLPDVTEKENPKPIKRAEGLIEFRNVSFSYDSVPALKDISFRIEPGTRVGLVGRTGSGKTTLTNLMVRFYDPSAGQILLDGIDLRDFKLADLRNQFAIVLQEPILFSTTIAENIGYGRPKATFDQVVAAAKAANAHDFIASLPDGYETVVGERGMTLSGGQRQIISLARAYLRDAPVMILDEPTSSVDLELEASILDAMERLMKGRTSILIAHRPTALKDRELYLYLEGGRLVEASSEPPAYMMQKLYEP